MNRRINRTLRNYLDAAVSYGHDRKGKGKRRASKARRRYDKALCDF